MAFVGAPMLRYCTIYAHLIGHWTSGAINTARATACSTVSEWETFDGCTSCSIAGTHWVATRICNLSNHNYNAVTIE